MSAEPKWQPFETAPKDGRVFLVWSPGGIATSGGPYGPSVDMCEWDEGHGDFIKHGCGLHYVTHWQPMIGPD